MIRSNDVRLESPAAGSLAAQRAAIVSMAQVRFAWAGRVAFSLGIETFALALGERLLLIGPSGSGKSTFLGLLCGINAPRSGHIEILGTDITALSASARDGFRAEHFGIIFQMFNLLPYASVMDNVLLPLSFAPRRRARARAAGSAEKDAARLLIGLGLEGSFSARAAELSVGQQQRVAAARALIGAPELIVADEPTSALDRDHQYAFLELLFQRASEAGSTLIMVSHDVSLAPRFDRVLALDAVAVARYGAGA